MRDVSAEFERDIIRETVNPVSPAKISQHRCHRVNAIRHISVVQ